MPMLDAQNVPQRRRYYAPLGLPTKIVPDWWTAWRGLPLLWFLFILDDCIRPGRKTKCFQISQKRSSLITCLSTLISCFFMWYSNNCLLCTAIVSGTVSKYAGRLVTLKWDQLWFNSSVSLALSTSYLGKVEAGFSIDKLFGITQNM